MDSLHAATPASEPPLASPERPAPRRRGADAYDALLWRLLPLLPEHHGVGSLIGVTSCSRGAGVSTVASNLAIRAADHHTRPVLLIEANPDRPRLGRRFRLRGKAGLADLLAGRSGMSEATHQTAVEGLEVMPIGSPELMDTVGLDPQRVEVLLDGFRESHELIVFDLPPVASLRHGLLFARSLDAALLAIRLGASGRNEAADAADRLRSDGVRLAGTVVTRWRDALPAWIRRRL